MTPVFDNLFPKNIDNTYRGHKSALWLLALIVLLKCLISLAAIFYGHGVAVSDGVPLTIFTPGAVQTIVTLFAVLGLAQLMVPLIGVLSLVRYRGLVPLVYALLLLEHLFRKLILYIMPIERVDTQRASIVSLVLIIMMIVGLVLSLWSHDKVAPQK